MKVQCEGKLFNRADAFRYVNDPNPLVAKLASIIRTWDDGGVPEMTTSGSTGSPKTLIHKREYIQWVIEQSAAFMGISGFQCAASTLPLDKAGGLMMVLRCLHFSWDLVCLPPVSDPFQFHPVNISYMALSPYQMQTICEHPDSLEGLKKVKNILLGGADVNEQIIKTFENHDVPVWLGYGMTETAGHIALRDLRNPDKGYSLFDGIRITANPWVKIEIDAFDIHLETRDLGYSESGKLYLKGRNIEWINSGGLKLFAPDMEKLVTEWFTDKGRSTECIIVGIPHIKLGDQIHGVLSGDIPEDVNWEALANALVLKFDKRLIPVHWHRIASIPRLQFKPDRGELVAFCQRETS